MSAILQENPHIEGLLKEQINLKNRLKIIEKELKPFLENLKTICFQKRLRKFSWGPFEITYTFPRKYLKLLVKMEQIQDAHPDWVKEEMGYDRLSIKKME